MTCPESTGDLLHPADLLVRRSHDVREQIFQLNQLPPLQSLTTPALPSLGCDRKSSLNRIGTRYASSNPDNRSRAATVFRAQMDPGQTDEVTCTSCEITCQIPFEKETSVNFRSVSLCSMYLHPIIPFHSSWLSVGVKCSHHQLNNRYI
jgi:hypothetical protein